MLQLVIDYARAQVLCCRFFFYIFFYDTIYFNTTLIPSLLCVGLENCLICKQNHTNLLHFSRQLITTPAKNFAFMLTTFC
jgi:hypothetical protein